MTERLLTIKEVADRLSVTTRTVHRYISAGKLVKVQLSGRAVRVSEADLARFIKERTVEELADEQVT